MTPAEIEKLERRLGYKFNSPDLLSQAMTHRSYGATNNERLEFLGDSILNFVIAEDLYQRFSEASEGQLSRLRAMMVKRKTLAEIARELKLGDALIMGSGELKSGGFTRDSILSDTLEAIVGAMYLESGFKVVQQRLTDWFADRLAGLSLDQSLKDAKSRLQEYLQAKHENLPQYEVINVVGESHEQTFTVQCTISLLPTPVTAEGMSRRVAEQNAAALVLQQLGVDHAKS